MKYALVTGGTRGIGKSISKMLVDKGYTVLANFASDENAAAMFKKELGRDGERLLPIRVQLDSYAAAQELKDKILAHTKTLDVLVLNAGATDRSPYGQVAPKMWEQVMNVNLNAPFYLVQALKGNIRDDVGRIIFISSVLGHTAYPHGTSISYCVSKTAIHQLARCLVKEYAARKITVNAIAPGFVDTEWQKEKPAAQRQRVEAKIALGRFAQPEEVAALCGNVIDNPYINGAILSIDGGYCYM